MFTSYHVPICSISRESSTSSSISSDTWSDPVWGVCHLAVFAMRWRRHSSIPSIVFVGYCKWLVRADQSEPLWSMLPRREVGTHCAMLLGLEGKEQVHAIASMQKHNPALTQALGFLLNGWFLLPVVQDISHSCSTHEKNTWTCPDANFWSQNPLKKTHTRTGLCSKHTHRKTPYMNCICERFMWGKETQTGEDGLKESFTLKPNLWNLWKRLKKRAWMSGWCVFLSGFPIAI